MRLLHACHQHDYTGMAYGKYWVSSLMFLLLTFSYLTDTEAKKFSIHLKMYGTNACVGIEIGLASSTKSLPMQRRGSSSCRKVVTQLSVPSSSGVLSQRLPSKDPCTNFVHDASLLNDCSATIQWNRVRRVKHGGHQFHHSIELHAPVGVLQSHGQSLRFCAYRLVADREDVAEGKTFRPTTLLVHPSRSGDYDWKTLESTDVQPTQLFKGIPATHFGSLLSSMALKL
ncbi:hypothetical protein Tsp_03962 [Trichinella spiralis]|uniref:hypothetical protein n=1 Tax=Trichinella spiralis TaxID=6334 RepID=UPI0001EFCAD4|nr:hypothetical protein Tsp_03962 [Trichinella spiralis]